MHRSTPTQEVKRLAARLGFDLVGITSATPFSDKEAITLERIHQGLMDGLPWFTPQRVRRGTRPEELLPGVRSIIALAINYYTSDPPAAKGDAGPVGRVSRYAWGQDYHAVAEAKLKRFIEGLRELGATQAKPYIDTGPMLDRAVSQRAGIGWYGKNTTVLTRDYGSWVFLAQVLSDLELEEDKAVAKSCGNCRRCIPACPTGAIVAPYVIDNRSCISYLTIECKGSIARELRPLMGDWIFGCDICQDVCPVNERNARNSDEEAFQPREAMRYRPDLLRILEMGENEFQEVYRGSPIKRAKLRGLKRNVCVALGNIGDHRAVPALVASLRSQESLVRAHAAWALGRIGGREARQALEEASQTEQDPEVVEEVHLALTELNNRSEKPPVSIGL